ncbi:hypothetical protein VVD49_09420 [Uliginosibacterium sp. H3]|uniref:Uncharacterized protein n=1 Tax=Uliginosibacterium silvisoli TaxID=3114758 RepID=A0ABU6K2C1_9RHOO|nr:hypothetical protein [Uliginosibacterium sp. H3]
MSLPPSGLALDLQELDMITTKKLVSAVVPLVICGGLAAPAIASTILTCAGNGSVSDTQMTSSQEYSYQSHSFEKSTTGSTTVKKPFSGTANVELSEGSVRMKLPHDLVPPLSDGKDAWYTLGDAFVGDKEITGSLRFNLFNKPKIRIDRVSGQFTLSSGFAEFNANCSVVDPNAGPKF